MFSEEIVVVVSSQDDAMISGCRAWLHIEYLSNGTV